MPIRTVERHDGAVVSVPSLHEFNMINESEANPEPRRISAEDVVRVPLTVGGGVVGGSFVGGLLFPTGGPVVGAILGGLAGAGLSAADFLRRREN